MYRYGEERIHNHYNKVRREYGYMQIRISNILPYKGKVIIPIIKYF